MEKNMSKLGRILQYFIIIFAITIGLVLWQRWKHPRLHQYAKFQPDHFKLKDQDRINELTSNHLWVADFTFDKGQNPEMNDLLLTDLSQQSEDQTPLSVILFSTQDKPSPQITKTAKCLFINGSKAEMVQIAQKDFQVPIPSSQDEPTQWGEFFNSPHLILVDQQGYIRGYYNGSTVQHQIDLDIQKLYTEKREQDSSFWHSLQWFLRIG